MKKIVNPIPAGGFPLTNDGLLILQENIYTAINLLYGTVAGSWIVSGCDVININNTNSTCTLIGGWVFINGELRSVPYTSTSYPFYVVPAADAYETKQYGNGAVQNAFVNKTATVTTTQPTQTDAFLTFSPTNSKRLKGIINADVYAALQSEIQDRVDADNDLRSSLNNEATTRGNADTQLQTNINNLTTLVNTKQTRVTPKQAWIDLVQFCGPTANGGNNTLSTYFTSTENTNDPNITYYGYPREKFGIMRTEDGICHVRGYLKGNGGGPIISGGLPVACRPQKAVTFSVSYTHDGNSIYQTKVTSQFDISILPDGSVYCDVHYSVPKNDSQDITGNSLIGLHPWFVLNFSYSVE